MSIPDDLRAKAGMSPFDEKECLAFDPFTNTKGDSDERILSDRIVLARKAGLCSICGGTIQPGEYVRRQAAIVDREMCSCRCCQACCVAMAASWHDDGEAIEARFDIGFAKTHPDCVAEDKTP